VFQVTRAYNVQTSSQSPPPKKPNPDNTLLYVALGLAAAGGAYFYFNNPEDVKDLKDRAQREATELKQKGKDTVEDAQNKADQLKVGCCPQSFAILFIAFSITVSKPRQD
jgi:hypothetical protein